MTQRQASEGAQEMTNTPKALREELERLGKGPVEAHHIAVWMEANYHQILSALRVVEVMGPSLTAIAKERARQIADEGWSVQHDHQAHTRGDLALAAASYAYSSTLTDAEAAEQAEALWGRRRGVSHLIAKFWPWDARWFKPKGSVRDLERAGALIVAELDRRLQKAPT